MRPYVSILAAFRYYNSTISSTKNNKSGSKFMRHNTSVCRNLRHVMLLLQVIYWIKCGYPFVYPLLSADNACCCLLNSGYFFLVHFMCFITSIKVNLFSSINQQMPTCEDVQLYLFIHYTDMFRLLLWSFSGCRTVMVQKILQWLHKINDQIISRFFSVCLYYMSLCRWLGNNEMSNRVFEYTYTNIAQK